MGVISMSSYFDLGVYSRSASMEPLAQTWFDRGLVWLFAYNHEEAVVCFERALEADPACALAHWGIAYALGPNYNKPWEIFTPEEKAPALERAHAALAAGLALKSAKPVELALLAALASRYPTDPEIEDYQPFNDGFSAAMKPVYEAYPEDLDVVFVYVEALMNRTPWQLWDTQNGVPNPDASTPEAMAAMEHAFDHTTGAWDHPGLLHMYIHLMEMSPTPEKALRHGDRLTDLVPDSGHLVHMATHIDVLCGDYQTVVARNHVAAEIDRKYEAAAGAQNFYTLYRIHNVHFEAYGAMFLGQPEVALAAADRLMEMLPDPVVRFMPDLLESFYGKKIHVMVRFGMWDEILAEPCPVDRTLYCYTTAAMHQARAIALTNIGRHDGALAERDQAKAAQAAVPEEWYVFNNPAEDVLAEIGRASCRER